MQKKKKEKLRDLKKTEDCFFLTAIWPHHGQFWAIIGGRGGVLTRC